MPNFEVLKQLAYYAARNEVPKEMKNLSEYSETITTPEDVQNAFIEELRPYCSSIARFMDNRYKLYEIITENADEIMPKNVIDALGIFANVRFMPQGTKIEFKTSNYGSKQRAKKFITKVGLSGVYRTFRLDSDSYTVEAHAIGGAGRVDFERILDRAENLADVMEVLTDGITETTFVEVQRALLAAANSMGESNKVIDSKFDGQKMFKLCGIAKGYSGNGGTAVIFAYPEFVAEMGPDAIVPVTAQGAQGIYHPDDIDRIHNQGYINIFRGFPIVQLPQSYVDTTNTKTYGNPQYAFIMPSGREKVVDVVYEGNTQMWDNNGMDQTLEINMYRKLGVAIKTFYTWCIYQNTSIEDTSYNPYPNI